MTPEDLARRLREGDASPETLRRAAACIEELVAVAHDLPSAIARIRSVALGSSRDELDARLDEACDLLAREDGAPDAMLEALLDGVRWGAVAGRASSAPAAILRILRPADLSLSLEWRRPIEADEDLSEVLATVESALRGGGVKEAA